MKITATQLRELDACPSQVDLFVSLFGEEVWLTREVILEHGRKFDIGWAASRLLSMTAHDSYIDATRGPYWDHLRAAQKARDVALESGVIEDLVAYAASVANHNTYVDVAVAAFANAVELMDHPSTSHPSASGSE